MAAAGLCFMAGWLRPTEPLIIARDEGDAAQISPAIWDRTIEQRRVYPMSVVPGGVYSSAEAERAASADRVVAVHYAGLNVGRLERVLLEEPVLRYVSFRRGNQVYWTRRPMPIPAGEAVLADGDSMVRSRCGNRLSESPEDPVLPATEPQPTVADLEIPMPAEIAPPFLAAYVASDAHGDGGSDEPVEPVGRVSGTAAMAGGPSPAAIPAVVPSPSASASVPGFRGFNALSGGTGSGLRPPSQNPALSGPEGVAPLEPDRLAPLPPQIRPELVQPSNTGSISEIVLAVLSPGRQGGTGTEAGVSVAPVPDFSNVVVSSPVVSAPSGGGSPEQAPMLYNPYGQVLSPALVPPVVPGLPRSDAVFGGSTGTGGGGTSSLLLSTEIVSTETDSGGAVPEPGSMVLLGAGLAALLRARGVYCLVVPKGA